MEFSKIGVYWDLLRKGQEVADPAKWKSHQITATVVGGLIIAAINLLKAYGYDLPVTPDTANSIGVGVIAVVNVLLTVTTSKRAGLLPAKPEPAAVQQEVPADEPAPVVDIVQPVASAAEEKVIEPKPFDDYIYRG